MNKEEELVDLRSDRKPNKELFIKEPYIFFKNMRIPLTHRISALSVASALVQSMGSQKPSTIEIIFLEQPKPDWGEIAKRFTVDVNTIPLGEKSLIERSDFDFQKQSKRNRFRQDLKSQKFKTKHRHRTSQ